MIVDKISNAARYTGLIKNLDAALAFIGGNYDLPQGRHEFPGGAVIPAQGVTLHLGQKDFEAHQDYADVMFVLDHDETVSYRQVEERTLAKPYDPAGDIAFYTGQEMDIVVTVPKGYFYAVLPGEGHKPCIHLDAQKPFKKYIIKCMQGE